MTNSNSSDTQQCPECLLWFTIVDTHLVRTHGYVRGSDNKPRKPAAVSSDEALRGRVSFVVYDCLRRSRGKKRRHIDIADEIADDIVAAVHEHYEPKSLDVTNT